MPPPIFNTRTFQPAKRDAPTNNPGGEWFKTNFGGNEKNAKIAGNDNKIIFNGGSSKEEQETLLRKTGAQVGRLLEGGTDLVVAPAKWLAHMQENW